MEHNHLSNGHTGHYGVDVIASILLAVGAIVFDNITSSPGDIIFTVSKLAAILASLASLTVSISVLYDKYIKKKK